MIRIFLSLFLSLFFIINAFGFDDWSQYLDVYDDAHETFQKPVTQQQYQEAVDSVQNLDGRSIKEFRKKEAERLKKKDPNYKPKKEKPPISTSSDVVFEPEIKVFRFTTPLSYNGVVVPVGFYKLKMRQEGEKYYFDFMQGKKVMVSVDTKIVKPSSFCKDEIECMKHEIVDGRYFKVYYKTLDIALIGYLLIEK